MVQRDNILELAGVPPSELKQIKEKRDQEPGNVALDWDYGQAKIEVYIDDNVEPDRKIYSIFSSCSSGAIETHFYFY